MDTLDTAGQKVCLKELNMEQLEELVTGLGEKKFRAKQIAKWLFEKGAVTIGEMTDLPAEFRNQLEEIAYPGGIYIVKKQVSREDETQKYLFGLEDGNAVEGVLMHYKHGITACVSSQVGCRMNCRFCASGMEGLVRNLKVYEIYEQVTAMQNDIGKRISNVVLMGSGEPLDNYDNVLDFIKLITSKQGLNLSQRNITLSTCGLVPQIQKLASEGIPINLAVSLHAAEDALRNNLIPINKKYPLNDLLPACKNYASITGRRVTFEYALIKGINDEREHAEKLSRKLRGILCLVNLIPANDVEELGIRASSRKKVYFFKDILEDNGINVTIRRKLGTDIDAACGQLRRRFAGA